MKIKYIRDNADKKKPLEETSDVIKDKEYQEIISANQETQDWVEGYKEDTGGLTPNVLAGASPQLPVDEIGVTEPVEQQSDDETNLTGRQKLIKEIEESSIPGAEGKTKLAVTGPILAKPGDTDPRDDDKTRAQLTEEERQRQEDNTSVYYLKNDFFDYTDPKSLKQRFKHKRSTKGEVLNSVVATGMEFQSILPAQEKSLAQDNSPLAMTLKNYLVSKNILNAPGQSTGAPMRFNRKFANAMGIGVLKLIQDHINRREISYQKQIEGEEITDAELYTLAAGYGSDMMEVGIVQGEKLQPELLRGKIGVSLINSLTENPNKKGKFFMDYGGEGEIFQRENPEAFEMFETIALSIVNDMGFFEEVTDEVLGETYYALTQDATEYYDNARDVLWAMGLSEKEDVSLVPLKKTEGEAIPFSPTDKAKGASTVKSLAQKNKKIQGKIKGYMGSVEYKIDKELTALAKSVIEYLIGTPTLYQGRPIIKFLEHPPERAITDQDRQLMQEDLDRRYGTNPELIRDPKLGKFVQASEPEKQEIAKQKEDRLKWLGKKLSKDESKFYSIDPWAEMVGLHYGKWREHFDHAMHNPGADADTATEHANTQMKMKARELYETLLDSDRLKDKVFYMKVFDAEANGRYHFRNAVMNPQNNKLARNIMSNARKKVIDLNKPLSEPDKIIMDSWKRIIGKNLLPLEVTRGVKTANLGWNSLLGFTEDVINKTNRTNEAVYNEWLRIGYELRGMTNNRVNLFALNKLIDTSNERTRGAAAFGAKALEVIRESREDWGYVFQSYIDFANFHDSQEKNFKGKLNVSENIGSVEFIEGERRTVSLDDSDYETINNLQTQLNDPELDEASKSIVESQLMELTQDISWGDQIPGNRNVFVPKAQGQWDGKQNGIAFQAMQNGDVDLMKRVGAIYSSEDNVIPQGDIRKLFGDNTTIAIENYVFKGGGDLLAAKRDFWLDVFDEFKSHDKASEIMKDLSKQPLMETSYGKHYRFHRETAENFINGEWGKIINRRLNSYSNRLPEGYEHDTIIDDLNDIIASTLLETLDLHHQKVLKRVGKLYSAMGVVPKFRGPLGNTIFMGSREFVESNKSIEVPTSRGIVRRQIGSLKASGSKRSKRQRVWNEELNEWGLTDPTPFGQEVSNQIPVLLTQHMDGAVLGTTINRVNDPRSPKEGTAYIIGIHDGIIVDATSAHLYTPVINKTFVDLNFQYSVPEVVDEAISTDFAAFLNRISKNPDKIHELSLDSKYRALQNYIDDVMKVIEEKKSVAQKIPIRDEKFINTVVRYGYRPEGSKVKGSDLARIYYAMNTHLNLSPMFNKWIKQSRAFKAKNFNKLHRVLEKRPDGTRYWRYTSSQY